jgi:uncharacterized cysteine cluster protein YcgN (CxxCxxCC family)
MYAPSVSQNYFRNAHTHFVADRKFVWRLYLMGRSKTTAARPLPDRCAVFCQAAAVMHGYRSIGIINIRCNASRLESCSCVAAPRVLKSKPSFSKDFVVA